MKGYFQQAKYNFATTVTVNSDYDGEHTESFLLKAAPDNVTVGVIPQENIYTDVYERVKPQKLSVSDLVSNGISCYSSSSGTLDFG